MTLLDNVSIMPKAKRPKKSTKTQPAKDKKTRTRATAESMAESQRDISVSEFFAKNRHLLGFDNPRKALLTTIKEGVDNSLDACEEGGILPDIGIEIHQLEEDRFRVIVDDNGPGIVQEQMSKIFGKLLYGSKFHRLRQSRGQQGIGISAAGMYFFYSRVGLQGTYVGVVLAHAALGIPFVIITVTATLVGFDRSLTRAAANMGANPVTTFFRVQMPLILPGVISGGLFAFITSFDEVVVVLFVGSAGQKTLPWQMFTGLREQISPTILAVATILVVISICLLTVVELLRRRSERLRGMSPG